MFYRLNFLKYSHFAGHIVVAVLEDAEVHKGVTAVNLSGSNLFILSVGAETLKLQHLGGYGNLALNVLGHLDNGIFIFRNKFPGAVLTLEDRSELVEITLVEDLAILLIGFNKLLGSGFVFIAHLQSRK